MFKNILKIIELFWRIVAKTAEVLWGLLPSLKKLIVSIVKIAFSGLFLGIVVGIIVAYLFSVPAIGLVDTEVRINGNKIDIAMKFENNGQSSAKNFDVRYFYGLEGMNPNDFGVIDSGDKVETVGVGEVISITKKDLPIHEEGKIVIIYLVAKYSDKSKIRQFINEKLLGNQFLIEKWMLHKSDEKNLLPLPQDIKEKYRCGLEERLEELY